MPILNISTAQEVIRKQYKLQKPTLDLINLNFLRSQANNALRFTNFYKLPTYIENDIDNKTPYGGAIDSYAPVNQFGKSVISWVYFNPVDIEVQATQAGNFDYPPLVVYQCLITVNQQRNIVKTKMLGKDGTVKTYMGKDDFVISIDGYILNSTPKQMVYPREDVDKLYRICNAPSTLSIYSPYLELFGITDVVIESYDFPQEEGGYSQQKFSLKLLSDIQPDTATLFSPYSI